MTGTKNVQISEENAQDPPTSSNGSCMCYNSDEICGMWSKCCNVSVSIFFLS